MAGLSLFLLTAACATSPRVSVAPCTIEKVGAAECGTLRVAENPAQPQGRTIDLHFVVLPAQQRSAEPIVVLQGGPGQAASSLADFYARTYAGARATHDIVLLDQRGTGASHPLTCDLGDSLDLFPLDAITRCRDELARDADLTQYTTANAVRDLEALRRAFGYDGLHLFGTSYGTRMALAYASTHPDRAKSLTLKGVVPPNAVISVGFAENTERSIDLLIEDCEADHACPGLREDYKKMRASLPAGELTSGRVGAAIRSMLQSTSSAANVPRLIHAAANGDWAPLTKAIQDIRKAAAHSVATGMMLSVACSEDYPRIAAPVPNDTLLGTYWMDQLRAACAVWPHAVAPPPPNNTLTIPALVISGYVDPATPPSMAEEALKILPDATHVVIRYGSHSFSGLAGCIDKVMVNFVETGKVEPGCAASVRRPPFPRD